MDDSDAEHLSEPKPFHFIDEGCPEQAASDEAEYDEPKRRRLWAKTPAINAPSYPTRVLIKLAEYNVR